MTDYLYKIIIHCVISDQHGNILIVNHDSFNKKIQSWHIASGIIEKSDTSIDISVQRILQTNAHIQHSAFRLAHSSVTTKSLGNELQLWYLCTPIYQPTTESKWCGAIAAGTASGSCAQ